MALMSSARNRTLERFHPDRNRVRVQPFSSWPGLSGPPVVARAGIGGPDKPGHDEVEGRSHVSSQRQNVLAALAASCLIFAYHEPLRAAPPQGADPNLAPWFQSLRQPQTNLSCCDRSDCRMVRYRILDGHFQAFIGGEFARWQNPPYAWVDVPEDSVLHRHDNPTGEGVACWAGTRIICFVEGTGA